MNCEQARPLIPLYADGELDATRIPGLDQHLRGCPACARAWNDLRTLKKSVSDDALFFTAPAELRSRVKTELRSQIGSEPDRTLWNWNWLNALATGVAAVCLAILVAVMLTRPSATRRLAQELASSHVRSLMANHTLDVASSDQHTVKPWFDGKIDFSPPLKDLAAQEFPLAGGRLDYVGGHPVAALVFQRHKHVINLFIWPAREMNSKPGAFASIQGYNLIHWTEGGMTFWAVSDLNEKEMMEFARLFAFGPG